MKSLVKTNGSLFPTIPSLMNDFLTKDWLDSSPGSWKMSGTTLPAVNIRETDDGFRIDVAAPGMKREYFRVELQDNILTISAEMDNGEEQENVDGNYTRHEFSYQSFQRSFSLPDHMVEGDKITAKYREGILHISIPKREEAKIRPAKQILVS